MAKFQLGDRVTKTKGSKWTGHVVGTYATDLTAEGYAVESETEKGSVQIYPAAALKHAPSAAAAPAASGGDNCEDCQIHRQAHYEIDAIVMGAGVFEVLHEGGVEPAWKNTIEAVKKLTTPQPSEAPRLRYFADGPQGSFFTNDLQLARDLVNLYDKDDDWTITDLENPYGPPNHGS